MKKNKIITVILIILIILQIAYKVYVDSKKEDFFIDELYSYGLMNYQKAYLFDEETFMQNWHNKEYFDEYLIISENEKNDWSSVYNNQAEDYHPPLYYCLLRIAASFTIGSFTKWTGLILNLFIFICAAIVVYLIGRKLFKSKIYALILVFVYGFSRFSTEDTLFIRMYQLLELNTLLLAYWAVKNYYNKNLKIKNMISLATIVILGTLTQYYFIFFYLGICITEIIRYIRKKQIKNLFKFVLVFIVSEVAVYLIWNPYIEQLTRGSGRNVKAGDLLADKITLFWSRQKEYFSILNDNMFNVKISYAFIFVIVLGIIALAIKLIKNKNQKVRFNKRINMIIIPTLIYWYIVTKTSQFIALRYILPTFVFIMIILMYVLRKEISTIVKNKKYTVIILSIISLIFVTFPNKKELKYQYPESKQKIENIKQYKDVPCIYMYTAKSVLENRFTLNLNYVREFNNVYIMNAMLFTTQELEKVLKDVDTSNGIIIFDNTVKIKKKVDKIVNELDEFSNYKKIESMTIDRAYADDIYLVY